MPNIGVTARRDAAARVRAPVRPLLRQLPAQHAAGRGRGAAAVVGPARPSRRRCASRRAGHAVPRLTEDYRSPDEPTLVVRSLRAGSIQAIHGRGLVRLGPRARVPARPAARGRRLRPGGREADRGVRRRAVRRGRRGGPARASRARDRADDRSGSGLRGPRDGGHRRQGALAGGQRPDDGGSGDRPPRRDAARDRHDRPAPAAADRRDADRAA